MRPILSDCVRRKLQFWRIQLAKKYQQDLCTVQMHDWNVRHVETLHGNVENTNCWKHQVLPYLSIALKKMQRMDTVPKLYDPPTSSTQPSGELTLHFKQKKSTLAPAPRINSHQYDGVKNVRTAIVGPSCSVSGSFQILLAILPCLVMHFNVTKLQTAKISCNLDSIQCMLPWSHRTVPWWAQRNMKSFGSITWTWLFPGYLTNC